MRHRLGLRLSGLAIAVAIGTHPAAAVDEEEQRAAAAIAATPVKPSVGFKTSAGDYTVRWLPYIETEGGVDTNPDNRFQEDGTGLLKLESGLKTTIEKLNEYYAFTLRGRYLDFMDIGEDKNRKDFKAAFDSVLNLSDEQTLSAGTYFLRDMISLPHVDIFHSYLEYAIRAPDYRLKLLAKNHTEKNFDDERQGATPFAEFAATRPQAFDYARSDAKASLLLNTSAMLQPFLIADIAGVDYFNQASAALIDRDATEQFGVAGVRFQFSDDFRIDLGYRLNWRQFDTPAIDRLQTDFVDVNIFWQPVETLRLTGVVERYFDESTSALGLVDDVTTYGVTFDWDVAPKWRLAGTAYYDREDAVGDDILNQKITSTLSLSHYYTDNLELFVSGLGKWVEEDVSGESYDRYKIGTGARLKF